MPSPRPSATVHASPAAAPDVDIRIDGVGHGTTPVLGPLHLRLQAGAITCLLGASGVGKSTLLRLLADGESRAGLSTRGVRIRCDDEAPLTGRVAWMDQRDLLLPWLDVLGNVMLGSRLRGEAPQPELARSLLAVNRSRSAIAWLIRLIALCCDLMQNIHR